MSTPASRSASPSVPGWPDGPGRIAPGQRVTCLPGSLPARDGGRGGGLLVSIGPKTSLVDLYGGARRRIRNELLHPEAGPTISLSRQARGLRTTNADGRGWLPGWSWLGWTIAEHIAFNQGRRRLPTPPPAPARLIIVACGARKANVFEAPAGKLYIGSYHKAARRAADAIAADAPRTRVMILSAMYGLVDLDDQIPCYDMRLGHRYAITAQGLREQAEQLGLIDTAEVVVLTPAAYANLAVHVWPHAQLPLAGTRGIGDQMARFAAIANRRLRRLDHPTGDRQRPPRATGTTTTHRPARSNRTHPNRNRENPANHPAAPVPLARVDAKTTRTGASPAVGGHPGQRSPPPSTTRQQSPGHTAHRIPRSSKRIEEEKCAGARASTPSATTSQKPGMCRPTPDLAAFHAGHSRTD